METRLTEGDMINRLRDVFGEITVTLMQPTLLHPAPTPGAVKESLGKR